MGMGKGVGAVVVVVVCCAAALGMAVRAEAQMEAVSAASDSLRGFTIELPFQLDARGCVTDGDGADEDMKDAPKEAGGPKELLAVEDGRSPPHKRQREPAAAAAPAASAGGRGPKGKDATG